MLDTKTTFCLNWYARQASFVPFEKPGRGGKWIRRRTHRLLSGSLHNLRPWCRDPRPTGVAGAIHELPLRQKTPISSRPSRLRVGHFFAFRKNLVQICNFCVKRLDTKTTFCLSRCVGRYFVRGKNRARRSVPLHNLRPWCRDPRPTGVAGAIHELPLR